MKINDRPAIVGICLSILQVLKIKFIKGGRDCRSRAFGELRTPPFWKKELRKLKNWGLQNHYAEQLSSIEEVVRMLAK